MITYCPTCANMLLGEYHSALQRHIIKHSLAVKIAAFVVHARVMS